MLQALWIGWRAAEALGRSGGHARLVAPLTRSRYLAAGGELLWLGTAGAAMHARSIMVDEMPPRERQRFRFAPDGPPPWRPPPYTPARPDRLRARAAALAGQVRRETPRDAPEFARVLAGARLAGPLAGLRPLLRRLARACDDDDSDSALALGRRLIGRGSGLTPAGDDLLGGLFFTRGLTGHPGWAAAARTLADEAEGRTHPISVVLTGDLLRGEGPSDLHELLQRLAAPRHDGRGAGRCARRLVTIGGSSGWNLLTGCLIALAGQQALGDAEAARR